VNPEYSTLTLTDPQAIIGRDIFDVFPDDPANPAADGVKNLSLSLSKVLYHAAPDRMMFQRYDIRDRTGAFVERYWSPANCPILDKNGEVEYIVHSVQDVTATVRRLKPVVGRISRI
jgi:hypothetical protein